MLSTNVSRALDCPRARRERESKGRVLPRVGGGAEGSAAQTKLRRLELGRNWDASQSLTFPFHSSPAFAPLFLGRRLGRAYLNVRSFVRSFIGSLIHQQL